MRLLVPCAHDVGLLVGAANPWSLAELRACTVRQGSHCLPRLLQVSLGHHLPALLTIRAISVDSKVLLNAVSEQEISTSSLLTTRWASWKSMHSVQIARHFCKLFQTAAASDLTLLISQRVSSNPRTPNESILMFSRLLLSLVLGG